MKVAKYMRAVLKVLALALGVWLAVAYPTQARIVLVSVAWLLAGGFMVVYQVKRRGDWIHYEMGRHLMTFAAALFILISLALLAFVIGPLGPGLWNVALLPLVYALARRMHMVLRRPHRKGDEGPSDETVRRGRRP